MNNLIPSDLIILIRAIVLGVEYAKPYPDAIEVNSTVIDKRKELNVHN